MDTQIAYRAFAEFEAAGSSPIYERLALAVADSERLVGMIDRLPAPKRQPNLLLAAARVAGAPLDDGPDFVDFLVSHWDEVSATMLTRSTQTNEAARTGTFLPLLAQLDGPIALIEVGCSAGLCLYPDRYGISYDGRAALNATSSVRIDVVTAGSVPIPARLPEVATRIGIDLDPLDVTDPSSRAWLEALIWPEHRTRLARFRAAAAVVADDPPNLIVGDLVDVIDDVLDGVPPGVRPVVFHSAVLNYVPEPRRVRFAEQIGRRSNVLWLCNEGPGVMPTMTTDLDPPSNASSRAFFILGANGSSVAIGDPHGSWIRWPADASGQLE